MSRALPESSAVIIPQRYSGGGFLLLKLFSSKTISLFGLIQRKMKLVNISEQKYCKPSLKAPVAAWWLLIWFLQISPYKTDSAGVKLDGVKLDGVKLALSPHHKSYNFQMESIWIPFGGRQDAALSLTWNSNWIIIQLETKLNKSETQIE